MTNKKRFSISNRIGATLSQIQIINSLRKENSFELLQFLSSSNVHEQDQFSGEVQKLMILAKHQIKYPNESK